MVWEKKKLQHILHLDGAIQLSLTIILLLLAWPLSSSALETSNSVTTDLKETFFDRMPFDGVMFTEDVLLEVPSRSSVECSKQCQKTQGCAMSTFHGRSPDEGPPPARCRIFGKVHSLAEDAWENSLGAESFGLSATPVACDGGYQLKCGRCLQAVNEELTYTGAQQRCSAMDGGHLAMPKTAEEVSCVLNFTEANGIAHPWVGADDQAENGAFKWNDGTPLPNDSHLWHQTLTSPESWLHCACMMGGETYLFYTDCGWERNFNCQKDSM